MRAAGVLEALIGQGKTLATAESCTGGMISAAITDIAGSSAAFDRGFVTYSNAAKIEMLGVSPATLNRLGAVCEAVATEMAEGARAHSAAQIAIAVTGIAGPGGSEHKPEGRVCFAIATDAGTRAETVEFGAIGRAEVRRKSTDHALGMVLAALSAS